MRILLTGGTGFVGGHVAERLAASGHRVRALTRGRDDGGVLAGAGAEPVRGTLEDPASLRAAVEGVEAVLHLAGLIRARRPSDYHEVNAGGTLRLLQACAESRPRPRRFVLVSSLGAQGPSRTGRPLREEDEAHPVSHYGWSKRRGERIARSFGDRMEVVVVRPPAVYGPRDRESLAFYRIAAAGLLPRLSGRDLRLVLVHVADLAEGIAAATTVPSAAGGVYHLCHPEVVELGGMLGVMARAAGREGRTLSLPRGLLRGAAFVSEQVATLLGRIPALSLDKAREISAPAWVADPSAARRDLGWEARIPADEGIPATAHWYRERGWL